MRCFLLSLILASSCAVAQSPPQANPVDILLQARDRLLSDTSRMPRYTCEQQIVRNFYKPRSSEPQSCATLVSQQANAVAPSSRDRLRLEVAIADNREVHSLPGAAQFNESGIRELVNGGPFGSGDFSAFVSAIFSGATQPTFVGLRTAEGRPLFEYTYSVTASASRYRLDVYPANTVTAYHGSFLLDPQSADLVRLTVQTAELPPATQACQASSEIQYERTNIHGRAVLVPRETDLRMIYRNGSAATAATTYSQCHEYTSHSSLRFDVSANEGVQGPRPQSSGLGSGKEVPLGVHFDCHILTPIDMKTSAGTVVDAVLRTPIRDEDEVFAPAGSHIHGWLVRVAEYNGKHQYFEADILFDSIDIHGTKVPLHASLRHYATPKLKSSEENGRGIRLSDLQTVAPHNVGVFLFPKRQLQVSDFDSSWMTAEPDAVPAFPDGVKPGEATQTTQSVVTKGTAQNFRLAIQYAERADDLLKTTLDADMTPSSPKLSEVAADRRNAIDAAKATDAETLNDIYPGLGDKFHSQFVQSLSMFVHGYEMSSESESAAKAEISRSTLLYDEWAGWYGAHRGDIDDAMRSNSGQIMATPALDSQAPSKN